MGEDVLDRDDVAALGLQGQVAVPSAGCKRGEFRAMTPPRTSNALKGLPLNSRTNSLAASADRSWMRTIDREGEMSRIIRRHSISASSAWTYLRKSAGEK